MKVRKDEAIEVSHESLNIFSLFNDTWSDRCPNSLFFSQNERQKNQIVIFAISFFALNITFTAADPGSSSSSGSSGYRKTHSRSSSQTLPPIPVGIPGPSGHIPDPTNGKGLPNSNMGKMDCEYAHGKCTRRMACGVAFHDYKISCKQELYGLTKNCSELCQLSMISLASTPEGYDYLHCDCEANDYCKLVRQRTEPCNPRKNSRQEIVMCKGAELFCRADTVCNTSYDYYRRHCNDLIQGKTRVCSRQCNNTVALLWRQKAGHSFKTCTCEKGSSRCRREREAIMKSCLGLHGYRAAASSSIALPTSLYLAILSLLAVRFIA